MKHAFLLLILIIQTGFISFSYAQDALNYNQISFNVSSEKSIDKDRLSVQFYAQHESVSVNDINTSINKKMQQALTIVKQYSDIQVETKSYRVNQIKEKNKSTWQGVQVLQLESNSITKMTTLMQRLQQFLIIGSTRFFVSTKASKKEQNSLLTEALLKFKQKAELLKEQLGAKDYKIVRLNVNQPNLNNYAQPFRAEFSRASSLSNIPAPALASGSAELKTSINSTIELLY